jgi:hypothetical protein
MNRLLIQLSERLPAMMPTENAGGPSWFGNESGAEFLATRAGEECVKFPVSQTINYFAPLIGRPEHDDVADCIRRMPGEVTADQDCAQRVRDEVDFSGSPRAALVDGFANSGLAQGFDAVGAGRIIQVQNAVALLLERFAHRFERATRAAQAMNENYVFLRGRSHNEE